jgi:hypothetical protein
LLVGNSKVPGHSRPQMLAIEKEKVRLHRA